MSSPRTWGCFCVRVSALIVKSVFPTHVGVFLEVAFSRRRMSGLPHARGGVSAASSSLFPVRPSSPRTWGCFRVQALMLCSLDVFPTHVGVFRRAAHRGLDMPVFPTHVEVFPVPLPKFMVKVCLPHARGGVSRSGRACPVLALSSPRTWGGAPSRGCPRKPLPHSWGFSRLPLT